MNEDNSKGEGVNIYKANNAKGNNSDNNNNNNNENSNNNDDDGDNNSNNNNNRMTATTNENINGKTTKNVDRVSADEGNSTKGN